MTNVYIKESDLDLSKIKKGYIFNGFIAINFRAEGFVRDMNLKEFDIKILTEDLNKALSGDFCKFEIVGQETFKNKKYYLAKVLKVIERKQNLFGGSIEKQDKNFYFVPHDKKIYLDFVVKDFNGNSLEINDKVLVSVIDYNFNSSKIPYCKIEKIMGKKGDSRAEIATYSEEKGFEVGFSKEIIEESEAIHKAGITSKDFIGRRDFSNVNTFTIDPYDAKDFDDAISVKFLEKNNIEIGVHIADVTHYLKEGSAMDNEAQKRTTSVYLVDRVVPMLPEILSNDLCSLVEGKPRLTMSAVFTMDKKGNILDKWFGETIINSWKRFTYEEAQKILQQNNAAEDINEKVNDSIKITEEVENKFKDELIELNRIAKILQKKRKANGAISMESEEIKFKLDAKGVPIEIIKKTRFDAHKLVEEFMLLANEEVAKYIHSLGEKNHVGVYRIHDKPDAEKMQILSTFLYNLGYNAPFKNDTIEQADLNRVMDELSDDPNKQTIQTQIVRSMQKAVYSTKNIGHYGLAFKYYSHFTSPIRRYPDDMTHRLLKRYLKGETTDEKESSWHEKMCFRSSEREKDAADAERQSIKYKQVEYMSARIGQEFLGIVTGLTNFGLFIEEEYSRCEGLLKYKDLGDGSEFFEFDKNNYVAKGDRGSIIRLGDVFKIKVIGTNLEDRMIEYKILEKVREMSKKKA
jgi:ribonuclease R